MCAYLATVPDIVVEDYWLKHYDDHDKSKNEGDDEIFVDAGTLALEGSGSETWNVENT